MNPPSAQPTPQPVSPSPLQTPPASPPIPPAAASRKKIFGIGVLVLLLIALPVTLLVLKNPQDIRQHASTAVDPNAIASVDGSNITQADLDKVASEFPADTPSELLDTVIERKILDEESKKTGITVSDADITAALAADNTQDFSAVKPFTKYQLLKDKITKAQVKYIEGYVIDFWLPPFDYPAKLSADKEAIVRQRRAKQQQVLDDIQSQLEQGVDPVAVARATYESYPIFQGSLGMNGKIITTSISDEELNEPYVYVLSSDRKQTDLSKTMEQMKEGEVRQVVPSDGSGGKVVKVTHINTASFSSYEEWLVDKKQKYVKYYKSL